MGFENFGTVSFTTEAKTEEFINYLKQNGFNFAMIKQLVGHTDSDITSGLYGKSFPPETLY